MSDVNDENKSELESIYDGDLSFKETKNKPILKPLSVINNGHLNFELINRRALWDYEQDKKKIDELIDANPKYLETRLLTIINQIIINFKTILHSKNCQIDNMKDCICDMIKICEEEYGPLNEDYIAEIHESAKKENSSKEEKLMEEPKKENPKEEKLIEGPKKEIPKEKEDTYYSDLLEEEIPKPKNKNFIPINQ